MNSASTRGEDVEYKNSAYTRGGDVEYKNSTSTREGDVKYKNSTCTGDVEYKNSISTGDVKYKNSTSAKMEMQNTRILPLLEVKITKNSTSARGGDVENLGLAAPPELVGGLNAGLIHSLRPEVILKKNRKFYQSKKNPSTVRMFCNINGPYKSNRNVSG